MVVKSRGGADLEVVTHLSPSCQPDVLFDLEGQHTSTTFNEASLTKRLASASITLLFSPGFPRILYFCVDISGLPHPSTTSRLHSHGYITFLYPTGTAQKQLAVQLLVVD